MKNFFINKLFPVTLPCFLGFNSKCTTSSQIIAKLLNFASTNSGNYGRFFTVSFKYIIFNRRLFDDFYKKLLTHYHLGDLKLGVYYSISLKLQLYGYKYRNMGEFEIILNSKNSFKVLFDEIIDKLRGFNVIYLIRYSKCIILSFHPITPTARSKINLLSCSQRRSYFTSTKVNSIDKDK